MITIFDATRPVKSARRFGAGLLAARPTYERTWTEADEAWLIEDNARREAESRMIDRSYAESAAVDALSRGLIPTDVAASLMGTVLVRHGT